MDQFERPRSRWFNLQSKLGHDKKDKDRGELEIRTAFTVKAGSLSDLSKKETNKSSSNNVSFGFGGSLLSLDTLEKRRGIIRGIIRKSAEVKIIKSSKKKNNKTEEKQKLYKEKRNNWNCVTTLLNKVVKCHKESASLIHGTQQQN